MICVLAAVTIATFLERLLTVQNGTARVTNSNTVVHPSGDVDYENILARIQQTKRIRCANGIPSVPSVRSKRFTQSSQA